MTDSVEATEATDATYRFNDSMTNPSHPAKAKQCQSWFGTLTLAPSDSACSSKLNWTIDDDDYYCCYYHYYSYNFYDNYDDDNCNSLYTGIFPVT